MRDDIPANGCDAFAIQCSRAEFSMSEVGTDKLMQPEGKVLHALLNKSSQIGRRSRRTVGVKKDRNTIMNDEIEFPVIKAEAARVRTAGLRHFRCRPVSRIRDCNYTC